MEIHRQPAAPKPSDIHVDPSMKMRTSEKPTHCPWCGSAKIALLLSGMPVFIPELEQALDGGGIALGNLSSGGDTPAWQCTDCCAQFFRPRTPSV
jgi:hypothetical protein